MSDVIVAIIIRFVSSSCLVKSPIELTFLTFVDNMEMVLLVMTQFVLHLN